MSIAHFKQLDWDFPEQNSRKFLHNLCWYPSRFIPMIPAQLIAALSDQGDVVLDPFGGSGTVLIETLRQNRKAICLDSNPLGCFIAETKARICSGEYFGLDRLNELLGELTLAYTSSKEGDLFQHKARLLQLKNSMIPNRVDITPWYHPQTLDELAAIYNYILRSEQELTKHILRLLFVSILMSSSGHESGRPYTYYADNVKPKRALRKDAFKLYRNKLKRFITEYEERFDAKPPKMHWDVFCADARNLSEFVSSRVDLIVTSPPYVSVTDYSTAFRLAHLWFDWNATLDELKQNEIGARSRRKKKNSVSEYLCDMEACYTQMVKCLKKGKHLCIVLGESKKHLEKVKNHIIPFLENTLKLKMVYSASREISQKFFLHPNGGVKTEDILIFRKVKNG